MSSKQIVNASEGICFRLANVVSLQRQSEVTLKCWISEKNDIKIWKLELFSVILQMKIIKQKQYANK